MRIPLSWLREHIEVPSSGDAIADAETLLADLVAVGFEEEAVHGTALTGPIVVGEVVDFVDEPQSNGKTIRWCHVQTAPGETRGIVCGAHNFVVGDKVVVSLPGAVLPGPFPISARKTYGHVSDGMIASARELGLGDEHDGILRLAELGLDPDVGTDAIALLGLDDAAAEINVTTDRGYALSIRGVAREYSHATGLAFTDPVTALDPGAVAGFPVAVADDAPLRGRVGCDVFIARVVRGVDPSKPTPAWMRARLQLAGIRSISLVVDITNYVMLELGQPIHAYDLGRLTGGITVRRARAGEKLTTLDDQVRTLHPEDLLITDESGPLGLAGVMGGASTEISSSTKDVLVEAAHFDAISIGRTARRHKLPSEASRRFSRGVDPLVAVPAAQRVVDLLVELAGGTADALGAEFVEVRAPQPIDLREGFVDALIGVDYSLDEVTGTLTAVGCRVEATDAGWRVTPPSWRPDLVDAASLTEEVARIVGYDRIPAVLPIAPPGRGLTRTQRVRRGVAAALASSGLTEVLAFPFSSDADIDLVDGPDAARMTIANAFDVDTARLRRSLLPGLMHVAHRNISRGLTDLALFELGTVFQPEAGRSYGVDDVPLTLERPVESVISALENSIPAQPRYVAALFTGERRARGIAQPSESAGIADALQAAHRIASVAGVTLRVTAGEHPMTHPGRTAALWVGETPVGVAAEVLPSIAAERDLPRRVAVVELDLDLLIALSGDEIEARVIAGYPAATQDLSVVVSESVPAGDVLEAVIDGAGPLLEAAWLVDDYRGAGVEPGSKSITLGLRFRADDRTLTAAEATEAKLAGLAAAAERCGAALRE